jgi:EmrB/QacA subfamily drug resistance transporter
MTSAVARIGESTRRRLVLAACILGSSIVFVDGTVVNVALPSIQRDLGGGLALQQWVVDAYLLTLGSLILLGGSLGDLYGERLVFSIGTALFGLTSVLCALAPSGAALIVGRALQGGAGALLTPAALAVITSTFSGEERGRAIGTWTAWTAIATVVGPLLGGWLITVSSWRAIFVINIPLVLLALAAIWIAVPSRRGMPRAEVDVTGAILCVLGLGGPVFALIEQPRRGWHDPVVVVSLVGGLVLLAAFAWWEEHASHPMLPPHLFRRWNFTVANVETLFAYGGLAIVVFFLSLHLQELAGYSPLQSGLAQLPITLVMFALSARAGRLAMRFGPRLFMGLAPVVCALGVVWMIPLGRRVDYWIDLLPGVLLFGLGLASLVAPLTSTVLAEAGEGDAGIASGVSNAVSRVAGLIAIAVVGVAAAGPDERLTLHGYRIAMAIAAVLLLAGGITGLAAIRNPGPSMVRSDR